ncbi:hypothetical protein [Nakamurella sp.]|uniref:hypothetical protein n=1 Tax=Nakamurella sp. TaxID=1869182 RepID=UPI003B3B6913
MNPMYTITITVLGTDAETSLREDVQSTMDVLRDGLDQWVEPGRKVRWEIRCPSGRVTAGQITVYDPGNTVRDVHRHLQTVRQVLTEEATDAART